MYAYASGARMIWLLAFISGVVGRMGGTGKYDTLYRDIGVSLLTVIAIILFQGFEINHIWGYALIFGLSWGALSKIGRAHV